ncbi:mCG1048529 [Mus musculus]|nr:mCG1048529 [Mus musculus]
MHFQLSLLPVTRWRKHHPKASGLYKKRSSARHRISRPVGSVEQGRGRDQAICGRVPGHSTTTHSTWHNAFFLTY